MDKIVPLISSLVCGPLGALHLPRLWLKVLLHAIDALPDGYRHGQGGMDEATFANLGIDAVTFIAYVETEHPTYRQCESWVKAHATKLDAESIFWHNLMIQTWRMSAENAVPRRAALGIADTRIDSSCVLNNLDDWNGVHAHVLARSKSP